MLKIVTIPNNILTTPTKSVAKIDARIRKLVFEMEKTLDTQVDPEGVGLAAPQIGENLAIFIMKPKKNKKHQVFINPRILESVIRNLQINKPHSAKASRGKGKKQPLEGCLSIPRIWGPIKRAKKLLLQYQVLTGAVKTGWFHGFEAMIIQHEVDHLNGILFTQRSVEQNGQLYEEKAGKLKKLEY